MVQRQIFFVVFAWCVLCVFGLVAVPVVADDSGAGSGVTSKPTVIRSWPGVEAFVTDGDRETVDRFRRVHVRTDLRRAVELACGSLSEHMNWDRCRRPPLGDPANRETSTRASGVYPELYWGAERLDDRTGRFGPAARTHALDTGVAHVVGRALWALLTTQDIISGAVHALCECWRHRCTVDDDAVRLNLLVDYSGPLVTVTSGLPREGRLTFRMATEKPLLVRVPDWVDPNTLRVTVQGQHVPVDISQGYVQIAHGAVGSEGSLQFALPCRVERESVDGTVYTTTWVGNQVVEILPRGTESPLPF